ncbi:MAG: hypothetical protein RMA76_06540 [Deltaproteobacteria bacterium]
MTPMILLAVATSTSGFEHVGLIDADFVAERSLALLPATFSVSSTFEQIAGPAVVLVEESGGFSDVDPEKVAIYGDSWTSTRWFVDGFDVSDPLFDGASAFHVPALATRRLTLRFEENPRVQRRQGVSWTTGVTRAASALVTTGDAGGRFPFAYPIMDVFSGRHARERTPPPTEERRQYGPSFRLELTEDVTLDGGHLAVAAHVSRLERRYLDFAWDGALNGIVPEQATRASALAIYRPDHGRYTVHGLAEIDARDRLFAEVGHQPRESSRLDRFATMLGVAFDGGHVGLTIARYDVRAQDRDFARDIVDPDGEALFPFEPDGTTTAARLAFAYERGAFYAWGEERALFWSPHVDAWSQPLTFQGAPYGRWDFSTRDTAQLIGDHRLGVRGAANDGLLTATYDLFVANQHAVNRSGRNALAFVDFGVKASLSLGGLGAVRPFATIAKTPMPITVQVARALDPAYLAARQTLNDGSTVEDVGGRFVSLDDRLSGPNVYRAGLGLDIGISEHFRFGAQGLFKLFRGYFRLDYDGAPERYGDFDGNVFHSNEREKRYLLTNPNDDYPVYFALHLDASTRGYERFFFSAAFAAYNAVGTTTFGNGPTANDVGVISALGASPNARRLGLAALDLDRAFILEVAAAWSPIDDLWLSASVRHRDGQPFSFLDVNERDDGRVALTYHSNRGSPYQYQRPLAGPREDFHLGADVQITYAIDAGEESVELWLLAANLFDMDNEIHEVNGPAGIDGRAALETQLPRSLHFGVTVRPQGSGGVSR